MRAQACTSWKADYAVSPKANHESEILTHSWTPVSNCSTFTFHHYVMCQNDGAAGSSPTPPSTPGSGTCRILSTTRTASSKDQYVRSNREYASRIFACQSTFGCSDYYGDGIHGAPVTDNSDDDSPTEPERWLLVGVEDYEDTTRAISGVVHGPEAIFYPSGFADEGYLGLWYMEIDGTTGAKEIQHRQSLDSGWNDFTDDTGTWSAETTVAQESDGGAFFQATNPWVVPAVDGSTHYIRMFLQVDSPSADFHIRSVDSTDENGADFGLECEDTGGCTVHSASWSHEDTGDTGVMGSCDDGDPCDYNGATTRREICENPTSADCFYLDHAAHGRIGWNSVDDGPVDFSTDEPFMLFTGIGDQTGVPPFTYCPGQPDDIYNATWDPGAQAWEVETVTLGGHDCPEREFDNKHDPYILPRADGTFKAYWNESLGDGLEPYVCYSDDGSPGSWEDCVLIEMGFDDLYPWDDDPDDPRDCVGDTTMFAYEEGGVRHEGGFTVPQDCFTPDEGLIFIEHMN